MNDFSIVIYIIILLYPLRDTRVAVVVVVVVLAVVVVRDNFTAIYN